MTGHRPTQVIAVVPSSGFGGDELLVLDSGADLTLPAGVTLAGERVLDAASRIVQETTGLLAVGQRVVYLLESPTAGIAVGVLCEVGALPDDLDSIRGVVVNLGRGDRDVQPMALREVLVEDLRSGFVRPVAHVIETVADGHRHVAVSW